MDHKIIIMANEELLRDVGASFFDSKGNRRQLVKRSNLDGQSNTWIIIGTIAVQILPLLLNYLKDHKAAKTIKSIEYKDSKVEIKVENPTTAVLAKIIARLDADTKKKK